jgi:hypothetical protein
LLVPLKFRLARRPALAGCAAKTVPAASGICFQNRYYFRATLKEFGQAAGAPGKSNAGFKFILLTGVERVRLFSIFRRAFVTG